MSMRLFVESRGHGPDLVLLHGWGLNSGVWESVTTDLQQHFRVTLIDLPGFGRNAECLPEPYALETLAESVLAHLPSDCILLGWSMGGLLAQQIAIEWPHRLRRLVLVASTPKFVQSDAWAGIKADVLGMFEQQLERDFSKTLDRFLAIQALGSETARQDIKQIRQHIQAYPIPAESALRAGLKLLFEVDLRGRLAQIKVPTHRLYGRLDSLVPQAAIAAIQTLQPNAQTEVFPHAAHAPFISHPSAFVDVLLEIKNAG